MKYHPRVLLLWAVLALLTGGAMYFGEGLAAFWIVLVGFPIAHVATFETGKCRACGGDGRVTSIGFLGIGGGGNQTSCYSCGGSGRRRRWTSAVLRQLLGIEAPPK